MKYLKFLYISILFLFGCNKEYDNSSRLNALELFNKSEELIRFSTEKIRSSSDSASIEIIRDEFEKKIVDLNFSFPANTDLQLTEQENDSISRLISNMNDLIKTKLISFRSEYINRKDSIESKL